MSSANPASLPSFSGQNQNANNPEDGAKERKESEEVLKERRHTFIRSLTTNLEARNWLARFPFLSYADDEKRLKWRLYHEQKKRNERMYEYDRIGLDQTRIQRTNDAVNLYDKVKPAKDMDEREARIAVLEEREMKKLSRGQRTR